MRCLRQLLGGGGAADLHPCAKSSLLMIRVSLALWGSVLFGLRLLDVVQDPLLGRFSQVCCANKAGWAVACAQPWMGRVGLFAPVCASPLLAAADLGLR